MACFEAIVQAYWFQNFFYGLRLVDSISKPQKIYCDDTATVFFSKDDNYSKGVKHTELKYFLVKEEVQKHKVIIGHISTKLMIAYPLTIG